MVVSVHVDGDLISINVTDFFFFFFFKERNNGVLCSNQIELVQVLMTFFVVMNKESKLELFLSPHTIVQYDKWGKTKVL